MLREKELSRKERTKEKIAPPNSLLFQRDLFPRAPQRKQEHGLLDDMVAGDCGHP